MQIKTSQITKERKKEKHPTVLHKPKFLTTRIWPSKGAVSLYSRQAKAGWNLTVRQAPALTFPAVSAQVCSHPALCNAALSALKFLEANIAVSYK